MTSELYKLLSRLADLPPRAAHLAWEAFLDGCSTIELAAANHDYELWARGDQLFPQAPWRSLFLCQARGAGKTWASISFMLREVAAGRAMRVALVAQSELKAVEIFVTGSSGILALAAPWMGASYESSSNVIRFANGAVATLYSAAEPSGLRGPQHSLGLATEIAAWPRSTAAETLSNLTLGLRLGYGKLILDSTPRRRNALIRERLALAAKDPEKHIVIRGSSELNELFLSPGVVREWREQMSGVQAAEELDGTYFDDAEGALFKQEWIDRSRRGRPEKFVRKIISCDPAISSAKYSDCTGLIEACLGVDGQISILKNFTGKHSAGVWPGLVVDAYVRGGASLVICESNRGGSTFAELLRNAAKERGLTLIELGPRETPGHVPGVIYYRPVHARGQKSERAEGVAGLVEKGKISFVAGELGDLEDRLCNFDGRDGAPDDAVDAFIHAVHELALSAPVHDPRLAFKGLTEINESLRRHRPAPRPLHISSGGWGAHGRKI